MGASFVRDHGMTSIKTAGTTNGTILIGATGSTAGNVLVARILFDNFSTASKPIVSSIAKPGGETNSWVFLGAARSTSTSAGSFASGEMWAIFTSVSWPANNSYAITLDSSVTMKAASLREFTGVTAVMRSTTGTAYSTTTTAASATTTGTTPVIGDLALGFLFGSNIASAPAGDTDTTAGSWSAADGVGSTGGSAATNNFGIGQYKVLTAATAQTYNSSAAGSAGNGAIVAILEGVPPPSAPTSAPTVAASASGGLDVTTPATLQGGALYYNLYQDGSLQQTGLLANTLTNVGVSDPTATYSYRVRGVNSGGESTDGPAATGSPNPAIPTFWASGSANNRVRLIGFVSGGATSTTQLDVYRGPTGGARTFVGSSTGVAGASGGIVFYDDTTAVNGTTYDYHAVATQTSPTTKSSGPTTIITTAPAAGTYMPVSDTVASTNYNIQSIGQFLLLGYDPTANPSLYDSIGTTSSASSLQVGIQPAIAGVVTAGSLTVNYQVSSSGPVMTATLFQGTSTTVATRTVANNTFTAQTFTLTAPEMALITDPTNLTVRLTTPSGTAVSNQVISIRVALTITPSGGGTQFAAFGVPL